MPLRPSAILPPKPPCLPGGPHHWRITSLPGGVQRHTCQRCEAVWDAPMQREDRWTSLRTHTHEEGG